jgi:aryl-phospho-beta-D-glucosidase BglC (GH1 family)
MEYLYDNQGKLVQATKDGTETETYIYGYNNQYVIGEVQNASFQSVSSILSSSFIQKISEADSISAADWNKLFTLKKLLPQSLVTFSQYSPLIGITKINYPNGTGWGFEYDKFGRLQKKCQISSDGVKRPVEEYEYNYKQ